MKLIVFRKKSKWMWVLLLLWLLAAVVVAAFTVTRSVAARERRLPVYSVDRQDRKIALTFNAAWGDETTEGVLSLLRAQGIRATFFFVGEFAEKYPESVKKIAAEGHALGNHSMTHKDPTRLTYAEILEEISACNDAVEKAAGVRPRLYRAPSGSYDNKTVEAALSLGLTAIQWSADSIDWKNITPEKMTRRIAEKAFPGAILLFHLGKENTLEALPGILRELQAARYEFCTVEELLLSGETYIDANGMQRIAESR